MSTILEALSRAERERRMGQMPAIERVLLEQPGLAAAIPRQRRTIHWILLGTAVLALAALLVTLGFVLRPAVPAASNSPRSEAWVPPAVSAVPVEPGAEPALELSMAQTLKPGSVAAADEPTRSARSHSRAGVPATASPGMASSQKPVQRSAAATAPVASAAAVAPAAAAPKRSAAAVTAAQMTAPAQPATPSRPSAGATETLPLLSDLPAATRKELPTINLGGYIYAAQASERSILINGKLLREGDQLAPGLRLEQMRADGVVFVYKDLRFRMTY